MFSKTYCYLMTVWYRMILVVWFEFRKVAITIPDCYLPHSPFFCYFFINWIINQCWQWNSFFSNIRLSTNIFTEYNKYKIVIISYHWDFEKYNTDLPSFCGLAAEDHFRSILLYRFRVWIGPSHQDFVLVNINYNAKLRLI